MCSPGSSPSPGSPPAGRGRLTVAVLALLQGLVEALAQGQVSLGGSTFQELLHLIVAGPVGRHGLLPGLLQATTWLGGGLGAAAPCHRSAGPAPSPWAARTSVLHRTGRAVPAPRDRPCPPRSAAPPRPQPRRPQPAPGPATDAPGRSARTWTGAAALAGSEEPPLKAPVMALPTTCPTAEPTATPAAVLAICAISPGCAGCAAGTGAAGAGLRREASQRGRRAGGQGGSPGPPPVPGGGRGRRGPRRAPAAARHRPSLPRPAPPRALRGAAAPHVTPGACSVAGGGSPGPAGAGAERGGVAAAALRRRRRQRAPPPRGAGPRPRGPSPEAAEGARL